MECNDARYIKLLMYLAFLYAITLIIVYALTIIKK